MRARLATVALTRPRSETVLPFQNPIGPNLVMETIFRWSWQSVPARVSAAEAVPSSKFVVSLATVAAAPLTVQPVGALDVPAPQTLNSMLWPQLKSTTAPVVPPPWNHALRSVDEVCTPPLVTT